ncbi:MAG: glycosyltransferase family 4 protein [Candidatus Zhuqueibacterota bacterium]
MKICIISKNAFLAVSKKNSQFAGGAEFQLIGLARALVSYGHLVSIITDDFGQYEKEITNGLIYYKVPFRYMGGANFWLIPDWFRLAKKILSIDADFYILKGPRFLLALLGYMNSRFRKNVVFISTIDTDSQPEILNKIDPFYHRMLYKFGLKNISYVVSQSITQQQNFKLNFNKNSWIIKNIYKTKNSNSDNNKQNYVLWVGTNNQLKRPELMLVFAKLLPEIKFKMAMIPSTDADIQQKFESDVTQVTNIDFLGFVPESKIGELYGEASLLVNFSKLEGFPNVFLHAWANKTPVITLEVDPDNVIKKYGLGYCAETMENMVKHVKSLLQNPEKLKEIGDNCYNYVKKEHAPEVIIRKYEELFETISQR